MTMQTSAKIWFDGQLVPWDEATVHIGAHAIHYGTSVFEGIRAYAQTDGPAVFCLEQHLDRLWTSCKVLGIEIPYTRHELTRLARKVGFTRVETETMGLWQSVGDHWGCGSFGQNRNGAEQTSILDRVMGATLLMFAWRDHTTRNSTGEEE